MPPSTRRGGALDLSMNVCCWGCPIALGQIAVILAIAGPGIFLGRLLTLRAGRLGRALGSALVAVGFLAGLVGLLAIFRDGVSWTVERTSTPEAALHLRRYDYLAMVGW